MGSKKLFEDVLNAREEQIAVRQERNLAAQDELIREREDLLAQIEHITTETAREQAAAAVKQEGLKRDRKNEITYRREVELEEDHAVELDQAKRDQERQIYQGAVEEEKSRLRGDIYTERVFPKPSGRPSTAQSVRFEDAPFRWSESRPQTANSSRPATADSSLSRYSRITGPFIH